MTLERAACFAARRYCNPSQSPWQLFCELRVSWLIGSQSDHELDHQGASEHADRCRCRYLIRRATTKPSTRSIIVDGSGM